jgi:3-phenylpropionate/trans-cinnamate dioxygenase ferredoxin subunit
MFNYSLLDESLLEFIPVGNLDEIKAAGRVFIEIDDRPIVLFCIADRFFAIGDVCSHDDGPLGDGDLNGDEVICPRHGASFDIHSGKALSLPAVIDIPAYPVRVVDGQVEVGIPKG